MYREIYVEYKIYIFFIYKIYIFFILYNREEYVAQRGQNNLLGKTFICKGHCLAIDSSSVHPRWCALASIAVPA